MPSQADLHNPRAYSIIEADRQDGELKTSNVPSDEVQREVATYREETSFSVYVKLASCVHGHLNGADSEAASLLIFEYEVHSTEDSSVVKSLQTSFKFAPTGPSTPSVIAYAPFVRRKFNFSKGDITSTKGVEATTGAKQGPAELGAKYSNQREKTHEQQYFEKVESRPGYNDRERRHDEIFFRFTQNKSQSSGVTPFFRTAMLVKRANQSPFKANFRLEFDGGFTYNASQSFKKVFGKAPDDPINFDPKAEPLFGDASIEIDYLGKYASGRELSKDLAPIWGVDVHADE
ncbi:hypothetical protein P154DRAFT_15354 [Amniculicola lignicola CBS 123094]|uniref:Uncharacterized protein n=1 Tax=Amniculicola lignicola CBS 123094 TaxID=1392246 RepID=A0A6A5X5J0_9PLEO|nr:hypothetical protein P154DRAFT_15354 [Amniculicola lignicola CBS 123094]